MHVLKKKTMFTVIVVRQNFSFEFGDSDVDSAVQAVFMVNKTHTNF